MLSKPILQGVHLLGVGSSSFNGWPREMFLILIIWTEKYQSFHLNDFVYFSRYLNSTTSQCVSGKNQQKFLCFFVLPLSLLPFMLISANIQEGEDSFLHLYDLRGNRLS